MTRKYKADTMTNFFYAMEYEEQQKFLMNIKATDDDQLSYY